MKLAEALTAGAGASPRGGAELLIAGVGAGDRAVATEVVFSVGAGVGAAGDVSAEVRVGAGAGVCVLLVGGLMMTAEGASEGCKKGSSVGAADWGGCAGGGAGMGKGVGGWTGLGVWGGGAAITPGVR